MKLTFGQIHDVVAGLSSLEDPEIKLSGETVLSVAININTLRPFASAYEKARAHLLSAAMKESEGVRNNQELEAKFMDRDHELRNTPEEVSVRTLDLKALDLDNNPKIRPFTVARLMPIMTGLPNA